MAKYIPVVKIHAQIELWADGIKKLSHGVEAEGDIYMKVAQLREIATRENMVNWEIFLIRKNTFFDKHVTREQQKKWTQKFKIK